MLLKHLICHVNHLLKILNNWQIGEEEIKQ